MGPCMGGDRTAGNTITTVQQAMSLFFQEDIRRRCVPGHGRPAADIADVIARGGTIYLLGREVPALCLTADDSIRRARARHCARGGQYRPRGDGCARPSTRFSTSCPPPHRCRPCAPGWPTSVPWGSPSSGPRRLGRSWRPSSKGAGSPHTRRPDQQPHRVRRILKDVAFNQEISDLLGQVRVSRVGYRPAR